jgi:hypothetical protein
MERVGVAFTFRLVRSAPLVSIRPTGVPGAEKGPLTVA